MAPQALHPVTTVLEQCHVSPSPAPAAGQPRALPLTFFDLAFWGLPPVQRLFFYANADLLEVSDFTLVELPKLKESLAAALHHFYPLAGKLTCQLAEVGVVPEPEVVFAHGDSVPLTVAVSGDDLEYLAGDHARNTTRLHPLLPALRRHRGGGSRSQEQDVLAVQVTVFPRAGICIGTTLHHAVADGSSYAHFLSTWAAIHRLGKKAPPAPLPLYDRAVVRDDAGLRDAFLRDHVALAAAGDDDGGLDGWDLSRRCLPGDVVVATFRFTDKQLRALGRHVESETSAPCSPYALACGAAWAGIVHARARHGDARARHGLAESGRDGDGGIEVGVALPRAEMEAFRAFYLDLFDRL
ncbi:unnamed protein product [Urochloa decumbens]|uniref:Uncharacterized protein n=1 Tax=Urochloa decumbens TaxID=240449 RepID=A0ABC9EFL2_9POAL